MTTAGRIAPLTPQRGEQRPAVTVGPEGPGETRTGGNARGPGAGKKRKHDLAVTPELVALFLKEFGWMAQGRHKRDRLAYRIIEYQANELAYARLAAQAAEGGRKWSERVK